MGNPGPATGILELFGTTTSSYDVVLFVQLLALHVGYEFHLMRPPENKRSAGDVGWGRERGAGTAGVGTAIQDAGTKKRNAGHLVRLGRTSVRISRDPVLNGAG